MTFLFVSDFFGTRKGFEAVFSEYPPDNGESSLDNKFSFDGSL